MRGKARSLPALAFLLVTISCSPLVASPRNTGVSSLIVYAVADEATTVSAVTMSLQGYATARIVISYAYTNSFTVSNVTSLGRSMYKIISSPMGIEFEGVDVDRYTFTADVRYATVTDQLIQVAIFSAEHPPEGIEYNVRGKVVKITVALTVEKEPKYPTAEEVAEAVVKQMSDSLQQFQVQQQKLVNQVSDTIVSIGSIAAIAFVLVVVLLIVVFRIHRRMAALSERGIG